MEKISVITGGFGGMGSETAKLVGRYSDIVLIDNYQPREAETVKMLEDLNIRVKTYIADVSDRTAVRKILREIAVSGEIVNMIHTAGYAPNQVETDRLIDVNINGTIHVTEESYEVLGEGSNLLNFSSMSAHMRSPSPQLNEIIDNYTQKGEYDAMIETIKQMIADAPDEGTRAGMAYPLTKYFVIRYSLANAMRFGQKGIRINSISPGSYLTFMRSANSKYSDAIIANAPIKRYGERAEIAATAAYICQATYMTGSDILADGGVIAGITIPQIP